MTKGGESSAKSNPLPSERNPALTRSNRKFSLEAGLPESDAFATIEALAKVEALKQVIHSESSESSDDEQDDDSLKLNSEIVARESVPVKSANPEPNLTDSEQQSVSCPTANSVPDENLQRSGSETQIVFPEKILQLGLKAPEGWANNLTFTSEHSSEFKPKIKPSSILRKSPFDKPLPTPAPSSPSQVRIMSTHNYEEKMMSFEEYIIKVKMKMKNLGRLIQRFQIEDIQGFHLVSNTVPNASMNEDLDEIKQLKSRIKEHLESALAKVEDNADQAEIIEDLLDDVASQFSSFMKSFSSHCMEVQKISQPPDFKANVMRNQAIYDKEKSSKMIDKLTNEVDSMVIGLEVDPDRFVGDIEKAKKWEKELEKIESSVDAACKGGLLPAGEPDLIKDALSDMAEAVEDKVNLLREEAKRRNIVWSSHGAGMSKTDHATWPAPFFGKFGEDYHQWKKEILQAFKTNQTPLHSQAAKLRSYLKSPAVDVIDKNEENIDVCFRKLESVYGSVHSIFTQKMTILQTLKTLTPLLNADSDPVKPEERLKQLINLLAKLEELKSMASADTELLNKFVHESTFVMLKKKLDPETKKKLIDRSSGKKNVDKVDILIAILEEEEVKAEEVTNEWKAVGEPSQKSKSKESTNCSLPAGYTAEEENSDKDVTPLKRDNSKLVACPFFSSIPGVSSCVRHKNSVSDCPEMIKLSPKERLKVLRDQKHTCLRCLSSFVEPILTDKSLQQLHDSKCWVLNSERGKRIIMCQGSGCKYPVLLCQYKDHISQSQKQHDFLKRKFPDYVTAVCGEATNVSGIEGRIINCALSNDEIQVKLKMLQQKIGQDTVLLPPPPEKIVFMLGYTPTMKEDALTLYDTGCGNLCMTDDIPHNYLKAIQTKKGPIPMWGVGQTEVFATGEYMISVPLITGARQSMVGLAMHEVTAPMPQVDLSRATNETLALAKMSHPDTVKWKLLDQVGGRVQLLMGIRYQTLLPKPVFTAPCGITIYEMQTACSDNVTHLIGGPSDVLSLVLENVGYNNFACHIKENLDHFRDFGPRISEITAVPVLDEKMSKLRQVEWEEEFEIPSGILEELNEETDILVESDEEKEIPGDDLCTFCQLCQCRQEAFNILQDLRKFEKQEDLGTSFDYRCSQCRNCIRCKQSEKMERTSIREEAEDTLIDKSVEIVENKFLIDLPVKTAPADVLAPDNKIVAAARLHKLCQKYQNNQEVVDSVKFSHQKLLDKGFCCKVSSLSPVLQKMIADAETKHHMVWNVVWNETSTSTPVRMVFNASCSTGKGYGSLNELLVKGSAELKSLLAYSIQWRTGLAAMTGDVEKCYNMLNLKEIWYPFQLYLWKDELNASSPTLLPFMVLFVWPVSVRVHSGSWETFYFWMPILLMLVSCSKCSDMLITLGRVLSHWSIWRIWQHELRLCLRRKLMCPSKVGLSVVQILLRSSRLNMIKVQCMKLG